MYQQQDIPLLFRNTFILCFFVPRIRLMKDLYIISFYAIFGNSAHINFVERLSFKNIKSAHELLRNMQQHHSLLCNIPLRNPLCCSVFLGCTLTVPW